MKTLFVIAGILLSSLVAFSQPTNLPTSDSVALTVNSNGVLKNYHTNFFLMNVDYARARGYPVPTNSATDGYIPVRRGDSYRWEQGGTNIAGQEGLSAIITNAITTNTPSGMTNVIVNIITNESVSFLFPLEKISTVDRFANAVDYGSVLAGNPSGWWAMNPSTFQKTNVGHKSFLTLEGGVIPDMTWSSTLPGESISGIVPADNLGTGHIPGGYSKVLFENNTWGALSAGGDLLSSRLLNEFYGTSGKMLGARTNIGAHDASNLSTGLVAQVRLASAVPTPGQMLVATDSNTAAWTDSTGSGLGGVTLTGDPADIGYVIISDSTTEAHWAPVQLGGDMLKEQNLGDVIRRDISLTNLTYPAYYSNGWYMGIALTNLTHPGLLTNGELAHARTNLGAHDADNLTAGTVAWARLPAATARLDGTNTWTGTNTFSTKVVASHAANTFSGTFTGDGSAVTDVDADLLDGQHGAYYRNASNLAEGNVPSARLATGSPSDGHVPTYNSGSVVWTAQSGGAPESLSTNGWAGPSAALSVAYPARKQFYVASADVTVTTLSGTSATTAEWAVLMVSNETASVIHLYIPSYWKTDDGSRDYLINAGKIGLLSVEAYGQKFTNAFYRMMY